MALTSLIQLVKTFNRHPAWRQQQQFQRLLVIWPQAVGAAVASNAQPVAIRRQRLVVATASPVWAQTLSFERHHILQKLQRHLPELACRDIQFSTANWNSPKGDIGNELAVWRDHPSRVAAKAKAKAPRPDSAPAAFHLWQQQVHSRAQGLPPCPRCGCATPKGELDRWAMCSLCIAQQWSIKR
ncbi:MAG: DUF721 domain-containing protein [Cyanobacteria bacterium P01_A01_bin.135]